ncbi:MAG: aldo/keto reductase [Propionicimonas sp.]
MTDLPVRTIGSLQVGALGLGCMGMSAVYGIPDRTEARATIERAIERGVTLFDTADMYGHGDNERFVGEALRRHRDQVVLATKVGITSLPLVGLPSGVNGRPDYIRRSIDASLRRLGTDHVELYYLHRVDPRVPIEDSVGAMSELVTAGKVRELGVSEVTGDQLRQAHAVHPIAAVQSEWSLFTRDIEADLVPAARALGVTIVPYSPLGRGMLTGSARATTELALLDYRRFLPRWRKANLATNLKAVEQVAGVARKVGATPAQVALAWLLSQGDDVVPIPGTKQVRYLEQNLGSLDVSLTPDLIAELASVRVAGERYAATSAPAGTPGGRRR